MKKLKIKFEDQSKNWNIWENNSEMIQRLARITQLTSSDEIPKGSIAISAKGASFALPLDDIIDVDEEKNRLSKSLDRLKKEISALKGRLQNSKFIESAPEEVILETQEILVLREEEEAKLSSAASQL